MKTKKSLLFTLFISFMILGFFAFRTGTRAQDGQPPVNAPSLSIMQPPAREPDRQAVSVAGISQPDHLGWQGIG